MSDLSTHPSSPSEIGLQASGPNYIDLVKFLVLPFLESPQSLKLDSEISPRTGRVLIRLAIEGEDKGRVFGRGGRNIQAVRSVVQAVAKASGQVAYLEIYGGTPAEHSGTGPSDKLRSPRSSPSRPTSRSRRPS